MGSGRFQRIIFYKVVIMRSAKKMFRSILIAATVALAAGTVAPSAAMASPPPATAISTQTPSIALPDGTEYVVDDSAREQLTAAQQELAQSDPAAYERTMALYAKTVAELQSNSTNASHSPVSTNACITVTKDALRAFAWIAIAYGGLVAAIGGFADATIVGLPAGAVLNALGIGTGLLGNVLLDRVNALPWSSKQVCV